MSKKKRIKYKMDRKLFAMSNISFTLWHSKQTGNKKRKKLKIMVNRAGLKTETNPNNLVMHYAKNDFYYRKIEK